MTMCQASNSNWTDFQSGIQFNPGFIEFETYYGLKIRISRPLLLQF